MIPAASRHPSRSRRDRLPRSRAGDYVTGDTLVVDGGRHDSRRCCCSAAEPLRRQGVAARRFGQTGPRRPAARTTRSPRCSTCGPARGPVPPLPTRSPVLGTRADYRRSRRRQQVANCWCTEHQARRQVALSCRTCLLPDRLLGIPRRPNLPAQRLFRDGGAYHSATRRRRRTSASRGRRTADGPEGPPGSSRPTAAALFHDHGRTSGPASVAHRDLAPCRESPCSTPAVKRRPQVSLQAETASPRGPALALAKPVTSRAPVSVGTGDRHAPSRCRVPSSARRSHESRFAPRPPVMLPRSRALRGSHCCRARDQLLRLRMYWAVVR